MEERVIREVLFTMAWMASKEQLSKNKYLYIRNRTSCFRKVEGRTGNAFGPGSVKPGLGCTKTPEETMHGIGAKVTILIVRSSWTQYQSPDLSSSHPARKIQGGLFTTQFWSELFTDTNERSKQGLQTGEWPMWRHGQKKWCAYDQVFYTSRAGTQWKQLVNPCNFWETVAGRVSLKEIAERSCANPKLMGVKDFWY